MLTELRDILFKKIYKRYDRNVNETMILTNLMKVNLKFRSQSNSMHKHKLARLYIHKFLCSENKSLYFHFEMFVFKYYLTDLWLRF